MAAFLPPLKKVVSGPGPGLGPHAGIPGGENVPYVLVVPEYQRVRFAPASVVLYTVLIMI